MQAARDCYRLVVVRGPQSGSAVTIDDTAATITLGSALERDIVLLDGQVPAHALSFGRDGDNLVLEVHEGSVRCDGQTLDSGRRHPCRTDVIYRIGTTAFRVQAPERAGDTDVDGHSHRAARAGRWNPLATMSRGKRIAATLAALSLAAMTALVGFETDLHGTPVRSADTVASGGNEHAPAATETDALARRLADAGFDALAVRRSGDGFSRVHGHVRSRHRLLELERLLADLRPSVTIDVFVQTEIVEQVSDVFHTHGLNALVESVRPGVVRVVTTERDAPPLERIGAAALTDVAGLLDVHARNEVPETSGPLRPTAPVARTPRPVIEPGKSVVAIIEGDPGYVVTEDRSKYLVGASLPTGHTIREIADGTVTLDLAGHITRLEF